MGPRRRRPRHLRELHTKANRLRWFNPSTAHQRPAHVRGHFRGGATPEGVCSTCAPRISGPLTRAPPLGPVDELLDERPHRPHHPLPARTDPPVQPQMPMPKTHDVSDFLLETLLFG